MPTIISPTEVTDLIGFMRQISVRVEALERLANEHFPNELKKHQEAVKQSTPSPASPDEFLHVLRRIAASFQ